MAEEVPTSSEARIQSPPSSANQPSHQAPPTIDFYEKIVDRAHREIEWVQGKYKLAAGILGGLAVLIFGAAYIFIPRTIDGLNQRIDKEAQLTRTLIERELSHHKDKAKDELEKYLDKQIAEQFGTQRIQDILGKVAATEAKEIIERKVEPEIAIAKNIIERLKSDLRKDVDNIRADFYTELEDLHKELDFQKKLREIQDLHNKAILYCSFKDVQDLHEYAYPISTDSYELARAGQFALHQIKMFYSSEANYIHGIQELSVPFDPYQWRNTSTDNILQLVTSTPNFPNAVLALKDRRECNVPEALLKIMNSDASLCARSAAMLAFRKVTFFKGDIFNFGEAQKWYDENRERFRKNLGCKE